jgi:sn-glycerol 3-phosphate transport system substrate-binding protein
VIAAIAAKQVPDLVMLSDVWWFKYALAKAITPLNDLLAFEKVDVADFQSSLIDDYKYNNSQWALPFARSTPLFYYNKRLWSAAGLPDRGPDTWAEFETWAPKLQEKLGSSDKFPFSLVKGDSYIAWTFQNIMWGQGGHTPRRISNSRLILPKLLPLDSLSATRCTRRSMRT